MGIRTQTLNNAKDWNESRRYKVNEVVKKQGFFYQNITGKNSDPFLLTDWIQVGKIEPKIYKALLTQTGTDAPNVVISENSIGEIIYTFQSNGIFVGTLPSVFLSGKTHINIGENSPSNSLTKAYRNSDNDFYIETMVISGGFVAGTNSILNETSLIIEIYP